MSALAALAFGTVTVGTTFALFTDKAETKINVKAGTVDVDNVISIKEVKELGGVAAVKDANADLYTNSIGSTTELLSNKAVKLTNWVPGDKAVFTIDSVNKSNVNIKTRFTVKHTSSAADKDLYPALTISYKALDENNQDIGYKFMDWNLLPAVSEADLANGGKVISKVEVTVEFADDGDKTIRERTEGANTNNAYQGKDCEITFTQEAVQGNADVKSKIEEMNELLAAEATPNKTMHEALSDVSSVMDASQLLTAGYVWNVETDRFAYPQEVTGSKYKYFKVYDAMPAVADQEFSVYAYGAGWTTTAVELTGIGFDAGTVSGIASVSYVGAADARTNTINTNSLNTAITINAANDVVHHYGEAGSVNIIAVAGESYHEFGTVPFVEIAAGRIVLEEESGVSTIYLDKNSSNKFNDITIALEEGVDMPKLSRDSVGVNLGEEKIKVCVVTEGSTSETYFLSGNGTLEDEKVYVSETGNAADAVAIDSAEASETAKAIANAKVSGEVVDTGYTEENKKEARYDVLDSYIEENAEIEYVARIGDKLYEDLESATQSLSSGQTLKLLKDVTVHTHRKGRDYLKSEAFIARLAPNAVLDGNGHTVKMGEEMNGCRFIADMFGTLKNITVENLTASLTGDIETGCLFDTVHIKGNINVTGNEGAFGIYAWDYNGDELRFKNCINEVNLHGTGTATDYNAAFVGYVINDGISVYFTNCVNKGNIICGSAGMFIGNPHGYAQKVYIDNFKNEGRVQRTYVPESQYRINQIFYGTVSDWNVTTYIDGETYTMAQIKAREAEEKIIDKGRFILGSENSTLGLARNENGTFRITGTEGAVTYKLNLGLYCSAIAGGSGRNYVSQSFLAEEVGESFNSDLLELEFVDAEWVEAHPEAELSHPERDETVSIYELGGKKYYLIDTTRFTLKGHATPAELFAISAYDAEGNLIASTGF